MMFMLDGAVVAAMGPTQGEGQPASWSVYFATNDADEAARKVDGAGGKVIAPPFEVFDQGRMGVFADTTGAFFSVWEAAKMPGVGKMGAPNTFGWCELNARGIEKVAAFYQEVLGWTPHRDHSIEGAPP